MLSIGISDKIGLSRKLIATVLAIIPGIGHVYLGAFRRGIGILVTGIGLLMVSYPGFLGINSVLTSNMTQGISMTSIMVLALMMVGLGAVGFWIWQILDARKIAKQQGIEG
ncbi:MAG TPA: hypothetical protein VGQ13_04445 [Nitrososphaera sp.]|nr:hypothetical protein [Nitrososphaera sp.]